MLVGFNTQPSNGLATVFSQEQMFTDIQTAYDSLKLRYPENKIIVLGYSLGTGLAANLASSNHPKQLILQAPYYNIADMMYREFPFIPTFILRYKFETNVFVQNCKMPITIFHGTADGVIPYSNAEKLKPFLKPADQFVTIEGGSHNDLNDFPLFHQKLDSLLR